MLVGSSFGGHIISFYKKFYPETKVKELLYISPVTVLSNELHNQLGDESDKEFLIQMNYWKNYYRDFENSDWNEIMSESPNQFNPIKNIEMLKELNVRIFHGKHDDIISYKRTELFTEALKKEQINVDYFLVEQGGHSDLTVKKEVLKYLGKKEQIIKTDRNFLVLYSNNIQNIHDFWSRLHVPILESEIDKCVIQLGGIELHYVLDTSEEIESYLFATKKEGRGIGNLHYFEVESIDTFFDLVAQINPSKLTDIKHNHWGGKEFLFSDPDGFLFAVYEI